MSNQQPQQQSLYSLQMLREQALNPQVDPREILAALLPHLEGMESIQQQLADAQAQTHAQAQAQSQSQAHNQPIHEAVQAMASMQQTYSHYHQQSQEILNTLSRRHHNTPAPLSAKFKGEAEGVTFVEFLSQLKNAFNRYPEALRTDQAKISYAFASMEGPPAQYFAPMISGQAPDTEGYLLSYAAFVKALDNTFGNQLQVDEANYQLQRLRQHGLTMNEYTTKFKTLVAHAGWEPNAALGRYKDGLSREVKDLLLNQWSSLKSLEETTVAANTAYRNMLTHNKFNKKDHRPLPKTFVPRRLPGQFGHNAAAAAGPSPMEIDAMRVKHITSEEKQRRREKNLCLYCGGSGHYATKCPAKNAHLAAVSVAPFDSDSENELA
jgi:hypothetical protein